MPAAGDEHLPRSMRGSAPGWRTRASLTFPLTTCGAGVAVAALGVSELAGRPAAGAFVIGIGVLFVMLGLPRRPGRASPRDVVHDGETALAVPRRGVAVPRSVAILVLLVASIGMLLEGDWGKLWGLPFALVMVAAGGVTLLHPRARRPEPIVLTREAVVLGPGSDPQRVRWDEITAAERMWRRVWPWWSRPSLFRNVIVLRGHDGGELATIPIERLATDPAQTVELLRERLRRAVT
ncbi:hypothetical protein [Georgenia alba]|uniref:PH domain-containing protein n=1 Tax=Georgenia alba TaxID=2233858 RepID=A0ABW2QFX3_9MICO